MHEWLRSGTGAVEERDVHRMQSLSFLPKQTPGRRDYAALPGEYTESYLSLVDNATTSFTFQLSFAFFPFPLRLCY